MLNNPELNIKTNEEGSSSRGPLRRIYDATLRKVLYGGNGRMPYDFSCYGLLPHSIIDSINAGKGLIEPKVVLEIAKAPKWEASAFYLLIRSLDKDRNTQREVLEKAVVAESRPGSYAGHLRGIVEENIDVLPENTEIKASKLLQINRTGPDQWNGKISNVTETIKTEHPEREVHVLAWATTTGIEHMARLSRLTGRDINLFVESMYLNPDDPVCGYKINGKEGRVSFLERDFPRTKNFVTFDDTVNTWGHYKRLWGFLLNQDPDYVAIDESRALYIDKTSSDGSAAPNKVA